MKKVLNLYAGIGGNRKLWANVEVTAIELNPDIAMIYQDFFPEDKVIVTDAHQYLLDHIRDEWVFIWDSPPCPTHSCMRAFAGVGSGQVKPQYPDMKLYEEILFLRAYSKAPFCVENVTSWYPPLVTPKSIGKHYFWSNFQISDFELPFMSEDTRNRIKLLSKFYGVDLSEYKLIPKLRILRNTVHPELGKHIFDCAFKFQQQKIMEANQ